MAREQRAKFPKEREKRRRENEEWILTKCREEEFLNRGVECVE